MADQGVQIGLSQLHYAILTKDDAKGVAYSTPKRLYGAVTASENPNPETNSFFADDGPYETATTLGQIELNISVANVPLSDKGILLGHEVVGGVMYSKSTDQPPWVAVGYQKLKSNGKYEYKWLLKGKAAEATEESETKGDSINYQAKNLTFAFVKRDFDDQWKKEADADDPGYVASVGANWFKSVDGTPVTAPLTFTTTPTADATGVALSDPIMATASVELDASTITPSNIFLSKDGVVVAGDIKLDQARKVITFTPAEELKASSKYMFVISTNVKSIYGKSTEGAKIVNFTTA